MKKASTFFAILFYYSVSFAQIDSYPLADYYRPDVQRKTANYTGDFSMVSNYANASNNLKNTRFVANLSGTMNFSNFKNTTKNQISSNTFYRFGFSHNTVLGENKYNSRFDTQILRGYSNKIFKNKKDRFFELNYTFNFNPNLYISKDQTNTSTTYRKSLYSKIQVPLYWGKGRIELVNAAWQAATILEFLREESLLQTTIVSHEEVTNFANRIAEIVQFRNSDFRLEDIAEFEALIAYLVENNLVDPNEYKTFAILLDAWRFESFITRRSGKEFKYGFISQMELNMSITSLNSLFNEGDGYVFETPTFLASIAYNSYNPMNMDWQIDFKNTLNIGFSNPDNYLTRDTRNLYFNGQIMLEQSIKYLPNQRTNYQLSLSTNYFIQSSLSSLNIVNRQSFFANLSARYNYYISPLLAWSLRANLSLRNNYSPFYHDIDNENGIFASISYRPY